MCRLPRQRYLLEERLWGLEAVKGRFSQKKVIPESLCPVRKQGVCTSVEVTFQTWAEGQGAGFSCVTSGTALGLLVPGAKGNCYRCSKGLSESYVTLERPKNIFLVLH